MNIIDWYINTINNIAVQLSISHEASDNFFIYAKTLLISMYFWIGKYNIWILSFEFKNKIND